MPTTNLISSIHNTKTDAVLKNNFQLDRESSSAKSPLNPFRAIERENALVSDKPNGMTSLRPEIKKLNEYALDLEQKIPGDLDHSYIEFEFQSNRLAYVRNGLLLAKLKYLKLYKEVGNGTFSSFCREKLQNTRWRSAFAPVRAKQDTKLYKLYNDTIKAARVTMDLIYAGFEILPKNISQAIAIASLQGDKLIKSWRRVVENIAPDKITQKSIRNLLFPVTEFPATTANIQVTRTLHESIHREAVKRGMSIAEMLQAMFDSFVKDSKSWKKSGNSHLVEVAKKSRKNAQNSKQVQDWQLNLFNLN